VSQSVDSEQWTADNGQRAVRSVGRRSLWSELMLGDSKREGPVEGVSCGSREL
jgi:hypothetical protein